MADYDYNYNNDDVYDTSRMSANLDAALVQAEREALRERQVTVRPAHLLIGLLQQSQAQQSDAFAVLRDLNVAVPVLIQKLGGPKRPATGRAGQSETKLQLATAANNAMGLAFDEADNRRSRSVNTGHMLLGLVREPSGEIAAALEEFGVTEAKLRRQVNARIKAREMAADDAPKLSVAQLAPASQSKTPNLDAFSRDVTSLARAGKLDPYIGDNVKLREILNILGKRSKNNPALIGEPGVGKTALVDGLAQYLLAHPEEFPEHMRGKRIVALDLGAMIAGTKYRGEFEERIKKAVADVIAAKDVILFIDELHTLVGAGAAEGAMDASNLLKPQLARGDLQVIGATTLDEFRKHIEKDAALERRFRPVYVEEPNLAKTVEILKGMRSTNEKWHKVTITDEALTTAARLAERFITTRRQPDKSLDLVDEACSRAIVKLYEVPEELRTMEARIDELAKKRAGTVDKTAKEALRDREIELRERYEVARDEWDSRRTSHDITIGPEEIAEVVAAWTGVPVNKLTESEATKLLHMEDELHKRVIGQEPAVKALSQSVRRARSGVKDPKRPAGTFIFLGPTGVGKSELAKALAEFLFDDEKALIRLDMSEYQEKHTVSRLVGAPPGYVGHDEGGQLTEPVRQRPFSVVLFDEIEKAHPEVFDVLLQVMEDGILTDTKGRKANFKDTTIIMTSNLGVRPGAAGGTMGAIGWAAAAMKSGGPTAKGKSEKYEDMEKRVREKVKETFKPEWLNRVDDIIVFGHLSPAELRQIVDLKVAMLDKRIFENKNVHVEVTLKARNHLGDIGFDAEYGARPLNRVMTKEIEDHVAEYLLGKKVGDGDTVKVDLSVTKDKKTKVETKTFTFEIIHKIVQKAAAQVEERAVA